MISGMKTAVVSSSESSVKSSTTSMDDERLEARDSFYFPGCRKDANCNCEICLESINATLDLLPQSIQKSTLTKLSAAKPIPRTPVAFPSVLSTPRSTSRPVAASPHLNSTARMSVHEKTKKKKKDLGSGLMTMRLILCVCFIFAAEFGFSWVVSRVLQPRLSPKMVKNVGEKSWVSSDLNGRMIFMQKEISSLVNGRIANCSSINSAWEINQDGLLLCSKCTLYKSTTEEVSIWGWPMQTAGLLTTQFSPRSFTLLSGRITQWPDGKALHLIRNANSSWAQGKWSASAVQFDRGTWILEYRQSSMMLNGRLFSAVMEFLMFKMTRGLKKMKHDFWLSFAFGSGDYYREFITQQQSTTIPT